MYKHTTQNPDKEEVIVWSICVDPNTEDVRVTANGHTALVIDTRYQLIIRGSVDHVLSEWDLDDANQIKYFGET